MKNRFDFRSLGRLKSGEMNKTEKRYSEMLETARQRGDILFWKFEAIKLRLADNTFYNPDFLVIDKSGLVEIHEIKGSKFIIQDDAKVKIKVAAELFPFVFKMIILNSKQMEIIEY